MSGGSGTAGRTGEMARWQVVGLSLAAGSVAVVDGWGTALGAVIFGPVVYAFVRLRRHGQGTETMAGSVATTMGATPGRFTVALQLTAYALFAAGGAQAVGLRPAAFAVASPDDVGGSWLWPAFAASALVLVALAAYALPTKIVAGIAGVLAGAALLIYVVLAIAVITLFTSGTASLPSGSQYFSIDLSVISSLALLTLGLVGFEVVTTRDAGIRSAGRVLAVVIGALVVVALVVWYADYRGGGGFRLSASEFASICYYLFEGRGIIAVFIATTAFSLGLTLAFLWAIRQLVSRFHWVAPELVYVAVVGVVAVLTVALCRNWGGFADKTSHVGEFLLLLAYAMVIEASARIGDENVVVWWSRILVPGAMAAIVVLPVVDAAFTGDAVWRVVIAAVLAAIAGGIATRGPRRELDKLPG